MSCKEIPAIVAKETGATASDTGTTATQTNPIHDGCKSRFPSGNGYLNSF